MVHCYYLLLFFHSRLSRLSILRAVLPIDGIRHPKAKYDDSRQCGNVLSYSQTSRKAQTMRKHEQTIGAAIVAWAASGESDAIIRPLTRSQYQTLHDAITDDRLPVRVRSVYGSGLTVIGRPQTVSGLTKATTVEADYQRRLLEALRDVLAVLSAWSRWEGLAETFGAPESVSHARKPIRRPWRDEQIENTDLYTWQAEKAADGTLIMPVWVNARINFRPSDAELDAMQIPGMGSPEDSRF
jgi:hypothetical protein